MVSNNEATDPTATSSSALPTPSMTSALNASSRGSGSGTATPTVSMLPRSSSSTFNNASSSGTAGPYTARMSTTLTSSATSPRRASSSLASAQTLSSGLANSATTSTAHRRVVQHPNTAAAAIASTDGQNAVPSLFGYYSHDAGAASEATNPSTSPPSIASNQSRQWTRNSAPSHSLANSFSSQRNHLGSPYIHGGAGTTASPRLGNASPYRGTPSQPLNHGSMLGTYQLFGPPDTASASLQPPPMFEEHSLISFSWTIRDLHLLRDEVERTSPPSQGGRSVSAGAGKSDVWTTQPIFGENKWRLELVRTQRQLQAGLSATATPAEGLPNSDDHLDQEMQPSSTDPAVESDEGVHAKAEIQATPPTSLTVLSVYLTNLTLDYSHSDVEIPASIMVGIRPAREPIGSRCSASGGWCWRQFYFYNFRREHEYFECHDLPSMSDLLEDEMIRTEDGFTLTIQLSRGPAMAARGESSELTSHMPPFEAKGAHLVPRSVLDALHGLLDDANTADIRVVVRERGLFGIASDPSDPVVFPYPIGSSIRDEDGHESWQSSSDKVCVRDRVLWAHSSILKSRSDYFKTMLASSFSEGLGQNVVGDISHHRSTSGEGGAVPAERQVRTLQIPDADFVTAYWFLRYLYTEEIQFADDEDIRSAVLDEDWTAGAGASADERRDGSLPNAPISGQQRMRWEWTLLSNILLDLEEGSDLQQQQQQTSYTKQSIFHSMGSATGTLPYSAFAGTFPRRQPHSGRAMLNTRASDGMLASASPPRSGTVEGPPTSPHFGSTASSLQQQQQQQITQPQSQPPSSAPLQPSTSSTSGAPAFQRSDPHPHPTEPPGKASALAIFKLAHRYNLSDLSALASAHLVASLTPASAFPLLLATSVYTDLHEKVKRFVHAHWEGVANSSEFERCCDEVGAGEWGPEAGKALRLFMKSLVSPARVVAVQQGR